MTTLRIKLLSLILSLLRFFLCTEAIPGNSTHFYNPIVDYVSPDPYIYLHDDGFYYFSHSDQFTLTILKSRSLTDWTQAETKIAFTVPTGMDSLWAPEIHFIRNNFYTYFAMSGNGTFHRMYVIKAEIASDPLGDWTYPIRVQPDEEEWAIDGTVLQYGDGNLYFLWSAWPRTDPIYPSNGSLYIAPMDDPMTVRTSRILLREPKSEWEAAADCCSPYTALVNEGPQILQYDSNRTLVVFSANGAWTPNYCLGVFGIDDLKDPLTPSNWWNDIDHCVFERNDEQGVYTTGHASFTTSPDRTEWWILYHATPKIAPPGELQEMRYARAEQFFWNTTTRLPEFPRPHSIYIPLPIPGGQEAR